MPEKTNNKGGQVISSTVPHKLLIIHPGLIDAAEITDEILRPINEWTDRQILSLPGDPEAVTQLVTRLQDQPDHGFDALLSLFEIGLPSLQTLPMPVVTPEGACTRAILSLGLSVSEVGMITDRRAPDVTVPASAMRAKVDPGDPASYGAAISRLLTAEAFVLGSLSFTTADRQLFSQMSRRPTMLARNAISAELSTLLGKRLPINTEPVVEASPDDRQRIHLTPRERQVIGLLMRGLSSKEIAAELAISPRTVDIYRSNLLTKVRARNTLQLLYLLRGDQANDPYGAGS